VPRTRRSGSLITEGGTRTVNLSEQSFHNAEPFHIEWFSAHGHSSPTVPISCIALIGFFAMLIGMNPRTPGAFVPLGRFVSSCPIAFGVPPLGDERERVFRRGFWPRGETDENRPRSSGILRDAMAGCHDTLRLTAQHWAILDAGPVASRLLIRHYSLRTVCNSEQPVVFLRCILRAEKAVGQQNGG
jgi:hypothetical protein